MIVAGNDKFGLGDCSALEEFVVRWIADNDFESLCRAYPQSVLADFAKQLLSFVFSDLRKSMDDGFVLSKDRARYA